MNKLLILPIILALVIRPAYAAQERVTIPELPEMDILEDSLDWQEKEISGEMKLDGSYDTKGALARLGDRLMETLRDNLRKELRQAAVLLVIALLSTLAESFSPAESPRRMVQLCSCSLAAIHLTSGMDSLFSQAIDALRRLSDYSKAAIPAIYTAAAAGGAAVSAPAKYAASSLAIDCMLSFGQRLILPLIQAYLALSISLGLFDSPLLRALSKFCHWAAATAMTGMTLGFGLYISLTGLIAGSTDAFAVKTARSVISGVLPVVGGVLADSAGLVLSAAAMIRNSAGVFALISVCALCLGPFALFGVKSLLLKASSVAVDMIQGSRLSAMIADLGKGMSLLLGLIGSGGIMLLISISAGIRTVAV